VIEGERLNLYQNMSGIPSRATAGTIDLMPGDNPESARRSDLSERVNNPVLLPVSCGYFFNIVR
jgi:hypothetical protein